MMVDWILLSEKKNNYLYFVLIYISVLIIIYEYV